MRGVWSASFLKQFAAGPAREAAAPAVPAGLFGLLLAAGGQYLLFRKSDVGLALVLFILGGAFVAWQWPAVERAIVAAPRALSRIRAWTLIVPLALAILGLGVATVQARSPRYAWGWLAAILLTLLVAGLIDFGRRRPGWPSLRRPGAEALLVAGLLAAAFLARVVLWDRVPPAPQLDDAELAVRARDVLTGRMTLPFNTGAFRISELYILFLTSFMLLPVDPVLAYMLAGAVPGTIAIWLTYVLAREVFSAPAAITAAALLAFSRWFILLSRLGSDFALSDVLVLASLLLAWRALRTGRLLAFVALGVVCGLILVQFYVALIALVIIPVLWLRERRRAARPSRQTLAGFALAALIAVAMLVPRALVLYNEISTVNYYASFATTNTGRLTGPIEVLDQLTQPLVGLVYRSWTGRPSYVFEDVPAPLLDPISIWLAMLGLGYLLYGAWRGRTWSTMLALGATLSVLIAASTRGPEASNYRTVISQPFLALGGGAALAALAGALGRRWPRARVVPTAAIGLVVVGVAYFAYTDYFIGFLQRDSLWRSSYPNQIVAGRWLRSQPELVASRLVLTTPDMGGHAAFQLTSPLGLVRRPQTFQVFQDDAGMPIPIALAPEIERVLLLSSTAPWDENNAGFIEEASKLYYPGADETPLIAPAGRRVATAYEWSRDAIESRQGLAVEPAARCVGGDRFGEGGWGGLMYVAERGRYRVRVGNARACVNIGLRQTNLEGQELYLARGWHELTIVTEGNVLPELALEREGRPALVPRANLYAGKLRPLGFLATFAESPGAPPFERRYLAGLGYHWALNPPTEGQSFYMEATGLFDIVKGAEYWLEVVVQGPTTATLDGEQVIQGAPRELTGLQTRRQLAAGTHTLTIKYQAVGLQPTLVRLFRVGEEPRRLDLRSVRPPS